MKKIRLMILREKMKDLVIWPRVCFDREVRFFFVIYLTWTEAFQFFLCIFLGKWGIGYQTTLSVDRSLGIGGLTIQLKSTLNGGFFQVSYVTHGPITLISYSDRTVFSFFFLSFFPFLSAKFLRDGWIDVPKIFRDGREWKYLEVFFF